MMMKGARQKGDKLICNFRPPPSSLDSLLSSSRISCCENEAARARSSSVGSWPLGSVDTPLFSLSFSRRSSCSSSYSAARAGAHSFALGNRLAAAPHDLLWWHHGKLKPLWRCLNWLACRRLLYCAKWVPWWNFSSSSMFHIDIFKRPPSQPSLLPWTLIISPLSLVSPHFRRGS